MARSPSTTLAALALFALCSAAPGQTPPATFQHVVSLGSESYAVDFALHSARGPNFSVQVQQANGALAAHAPGPARTYIGTLAMRPGAMASALRRASGSILYHVLFEDGAEWIHDGTSTVLRTDGDWVPAYPTSVAGPGGSGATVWAAEVGVDVPHSQYTVDGTIDAALEMVEHSVNTTNLIYLRDASVLHRLGRVVVRANALHDPYAGMTTTNALLGEIVTQWNSVLPPSTHDVGLVATSATGGGLAYVGVIGNPGYSSNGASGNGDFSIVWRHEVGHNWSLGHFDGGTPEGATINSGNALSRMSGSEQAKLITHRNARLAALDNLGPYPVPIPPCASLDRAKHVPQSPPLRLDVLANDHDANGDALTIASFDTISRLGGSIALSPGTGPSGRDELLYTPPATHQGADDHFRYRVSDATGREALGNVVTTYTAESELLAHYPMNEGSGSLARDSSAFLRNASLANGPTWAAGIAGSGVVFDGVDDRATCDALCVETNTFSITGWLKRDGAQNNWAGIIFCRGGTTTAGLNFGSANDLRYHWDNSHFNWSSGLVVPNDTWTFVALVVTPTSATVYMDAGQGLQSATRFGIHQPEAFDAALTLGRDPSGNARGFDGTLDEIRVFARALSPQDVAAAANGLGSAAEPVPARFARINASTPSLTWSAAPAATNHRVYLSNSYTDVRDGTPAADQGLTAASSWTTPLLGNGDWFWRIDSTDGTNWIEGPVWTFTTIPGFTAATAQTYGTGCPGSQAAIPQIGAIGLPQFGSATFAIEVTGGAPNSNAALWMALQQDAVPIDGCQLLLQLPIIPTPSQPTDPSGRGVLPLAIPLTASVLGTRLFGQWIVLDPGGALLGTASLSDGLHITVGI